MDPIVWIILILVVLVLATGLFAWVRHARRSGSVLAAPDRRDRS